MPAPASVALGAPSAATGVDTSRLALSAATVEGVKAIRDRAAAAGGERLAQCSCPRRP